MSAFQPCAAMPANTSSYKELGEQDYRRYTMSYAVIVTGGKQYKVAPGEYLKIEKLEIATGESVTFDRVQRMGHRQWYTEIKITGIQA
jgi:large subunit ribosomal protein L21